MDVAQYMVRCRDHLYLSLDKTPYRTMANPDFVELLCAVHELQFGPAYIDFFRAAVEPYLYVETCRECVMEALHRFCWINVSYPVGCSRGHIHGLGWIDGHNGQPSLVITPEQRERYAHGVGESCPPWFRNGGRGVVDAYWKRLIF